MRLLVIAAFIFLLGGVVTQAQTPATRPNRIGPWDEPVMPTTPGDHRMVYRVELHARSIELPYLLHLPPDYKDTAGPYPMLVFLHGAGECGSNLNGIYVWGPEQLLKEDGDEQFSKTCPFIVLSPQCSLRDPGWYEEPMTHDVIDLIEHVKANLRVDPDRVYCTGLSMGGAGTWDLALADPDLFAAIAPMCGSGYDPELASQLLKYVSVWSIEGELDYGNVGASRMMMNALKDSRVEVRQLILLKRGHNAWIPAYNNPQFYEWLLSKRRPSEDQKKILDQQFAQFQKTDASAPPLPSKPGHYLLWMDTQIGLQNTRLSYLLYLPRNYVSQGAKSPVLLFLHEAHAMGQDINDICMHGPDAELEKNENAALAGDFPFVIISPMRPIATSWNQPQTAQALIALVKDLTGKLNLDPTRICITGQDAGASGAWNTALAAPDYFAAMALICDKDKFIPKADSAAPLTGLPIWVSIPPDQTASIDNFNTIFSHFKAPWKIADLSPQPYANSDLYAWLMQQHRPD